MENREDLVSVLQSLYRWRKPILITTISAAILSIVISLLLPEYYRSSSTFYSASPDLNKPDIVFSDINANYDYYGSDADIDRILTIAESSDLVNFMIDSFDLYEVYDIEKDNPKALHYVSQSFLKLYEVSRTPFDAIKIEIEDKDPNRAAQMVNAARNMTNKMAVGLIRSSQQNQIRIHQSNMENQESAIQAIEDSLKSVRTSYGILNSESQSEVLSTLIMKAKANLARTRAQMKVLEDQGGYPDSLIIMQSRINGFQQELWSLQIGKTEGAASFKSYSEGISKFQNLNMRHEQLSREQSDLIDKLSKLKSSFISDIPAIHVVEKAKVPVIKSRPIRSLMIISSTLAAFIFSILGALLFDFYRNIDWQSVKRP